MSEEPETDSKLFYTIREVAEMFKENESTLRYWEKEFKIITPRKTNGGTRYYRPRDIENIRLIHHLLRDKGMTIAGARKKLKDNKKNTVNNEEVINRLKQLRAEILAIRDEL